MATCTAGGNVAPRRPTVFDTPAYRRLLRLLAQADDVMGTARGFLRAHKPGCRCRFCDWLEDERMAALDGQAAVLRDLQALLYNLRHSFVMIQGLLPPG